ncbi:MAG: tRNA (adenosine(37)-N6)-threonylcarbamoyltransferase complex transferase subunit TsaD, partial [Clostridia bacterium]
VPKADIAASFQVAAVGQMIDTLKIAMERTGVKKIAIAGGVSANKFLRQEADKLVADGVEVHYPKIKYCTDNAAMIGAAAYFIIKNGTAESGLDLDAKATVQLS